MFGLWQAAYLRRRERGYTMPHLRRAEKAEKSHKHRDMWDPETFYGPNRYN